MSLTDNYFQLFDLPEQYSLDNNVLRATYRDLQRKTHPDKFANASQQEQLLAVQYTATVNDAYDVLSSSLKRAIYMLKLKGFEIDPQQSAVMDPMFLVQQMELREELENVSRVDAPEVALEKISEQLEKDLEDLEKGFAAQIEVLDESNAVAAQDTVKKMQFVVKAQSEVEHLEHELLDG